MTITELAALRHAHPSAMRVWYDRMFDLEKGQLIETILARMTVQELRNTLEKLDAEIERDRAEDN